MVSPSRWYRYNILVVAGIAFVLLPLTAVAFDNSRFSDPTFNLLLVAGFFLSITTFFFPKIGLFVMLVSMLWATDVPVGQGRPMHGGRSITIRIEDVLLLLISGGWLIRRAATRTLSITRDVPINKPVCAMIMAIMIASTLGYLQGTNPLNRGFFFTLKRIEFFWLFFMTLNILETEKDGRFCIKLLLVASAFIAGYGIFQQFFNPVPGGVTTTAGFGRANTLGSFLLIVIGISLGMYVYGGSRKIIWYFFLFMGLLATLVFTKSRGAYVSMIPLIGVLAILSRSQRLFTLIASVIFFSVIIVTGSLALPYSVRQELGIQGKDIAGQFQSIGLVMRHGVRADSSLNARVRFWEYSVNEMIKYPILGQGVGSKGLGTADNQYVREILETGLVGFACFIYLNIMILRVTYLLFRSTPDADIRGFAFGFIGGHIGMLTHGLTISNFYTILNMEVFWFVTALIMLFYNRQLQLGLGINETNPH